jgi:hypothetical protein
MGMTTIGGRRQGYLVDEGLASGEVIVRQV